MKVFEQNSTPSIYAVKPDRGQATTCEEASQSTGNVGTVSTDNENKKEACPALGKTCN